jgi:hypothetical protein
MKTSKQAKLSITLKSVELIKELSLGLAPIGCIAARHFCNEISRTLINQAGEIDTLTAKIQNLATASNNYEVHWDSLIFAIMGADGTADIIDAADAERITDAAIATIKKLASDRDEKQRVAEAFQSVTNTESPIQRRRYYHNGAYAGFISRYSPNAKAHELKIAPEYLEAVICGQKTAETRINDRDFKVNDHLILREWENDGYTGWEHVVVITHVCDFPYVFTGERWVSLSITPVYGLDPDAVNRYLNSRRTA